jgi:hypothetical protein
VDRQLALSGSAVRNWVVRDLDAKLAPWQVARRDLRSSATVHIVYTDNATDFLSATIESILCSRRSYSSIPTNVEELSPWN